MLSIVYWQIYEHGGVIWLFGRKKQQQPKYDLEGSSENTESSTPRDWHVSMYVKPLRYQFFISVCTMQLMSSKHRLYVGACLKKTMYAVWMVPKLTLPVFLNVALLPRQLMGLL
jgi:hypothetical protein